MCVGGGGMTAVLTACIVTTAMRRTCDCRKQELRCHTGVADHASLLGCGAMSWGVPFWTFRRLHVSSSSERRFEGYMCLHFQSDVSKVTCVFIFRATFRRSHVSSSSERRFEGYMCLHFQSDVSKVTCFFIFRATFRMLHVSSSSERRFEGYMCLHLQSQAMQQNFRYFFKYNQQDATSYNILYYCQCQACLLLPLAVAPSKLGIYPMLCVQFLSS